MSRLIAKLLQLVGLCTLLGAAAAATMLTLAPHWLLSNDVPVRSDAIVVLGGAFTRPLHAADLYLQGLAPAVYVSVTEHEKGHDDLAALGITRPEQHEVYAQVLDRKGVPPLAVRYFGRGSVSTIEEAEALSKTMESVPERLLLVTSPFHARRARLIFQHRFPDTKVLVSPTPYEPVPDRWWTKQSSAFSVIMESIKALYYLCGGGFRSTDQAES